MIVKGNGSVMTIRGVLVPVEWSNDGAVEAIGIASFDEQEYKLEFTEDIDFWIDFLKQAIEIKGEKIQSKSRLDTLKVKKIKFI